MYNSDGTVKQIKRKLTSVHSEELNETYYFCDGVEVDPEEWEEEE